MPGRTSGDPSSDPTATDRVRVAENAWNLRDLDAVVLSNSIDCQWRSRADFVWGREQIRAYLTRQWRQEFERRMVSELWAADHNRLSIRFAREFRDDNGTWFRAYGNENWDLDASGLVKRRLTSVNEHTIREHERALRWQLGIRPDDHPSLSELGL